MEALRPSKKYCILHGKSSHSTDNCKNLPAMVNKHKQKKKTVQKLRREQQRAKCSNSKEISEICEEQEKEEDREGTSVLSRNADFK